MSVIARPTPRPRRFFFPNISALLCFGNKLAPPEVGWVTFWSGPVVRVVFYHCQMGMEYVVRFVLFCFGVGFVVTWSLVSPLSSSRFLFPIWRLRLRFRSSSVDQGSQGL